MRRRLLLLYLLLLFLMPPTAQAAPSDIVYDVLTITPKTAMNGENVTILFIITNNQPQEAVAGFIIEHHPPVYQILHEENMTLKYFQYAKSVTLQANETITYRFVLSSKYSGVNTILVSNPSGPDLAGTFTVREKHDHPITVSARPVFFTIGAPIIIPVSLIILILVVTLAYIILRFQELSKN